MLFVLPTTAQQLPLFTQYREYQGMINPAAINSDYFNWEHNLSIGASYRNQWTNLSGSPKTMALRGEYVMSENLLAGAYILNDQTGLIGLTGIYGRLAGMISFDNNSNNYNRNGSSSSNLLSFGLNIGYVQYRIKGDDIKLPDPNTPINYSNSTKYHPDVGLGIFYKTELNLMDFYAGISIPQVFGFNLEFEKNGETIQYERVRHYYGQIGCYKNFADGVFIEPSIWFKYTPNTPLNIDINIRYLQQGRFWFGGGVSQSFEQGTLMNLEIGIYAFNATSEYRNIKIGYGFGRPIGNLGEFGNTHEINVSYLLDTKG